jgi:hypothetical protein
VLAEDVAVLTELRQWYKPASNVGGCGSNTDGATTMPTELVGTTPVMTGADTRVGEAATALTVPAKEVHAEAVR